MKAKLFILMLSAVFVFASCKKDKPAPKPAPNPVNPTPEPTPGPDLIANPYITFTTTMEKGEILRLYVDAKESDKNNLWIDLNNNKTKDPGEEIIPGSDVNVFIVDVANITIYGRIWSFECSNSGLSQLDVSKNPWLISLYCYGNNIKNLDLSKNRILQILECFSNPELENLDLRYNEKLYSLNCTGNNHNYLDVSKNTNLHYLKCSRNKLSSLDLSGNPNLKELDICENNINGKEMGNLVESMPVVKTEADAEVRVIDTADENEKNKITKAQVQILTQKNWKVLDSEGNAYDGS